jgi:hypothetical protein
MTQDPKSIGLSDCCGAKASIGDVIHPDGSSDRAYICEKCQNLCALASEGASLSQRWCFGRKQKDWDVSEVENRDEILLIKDYKPAK